MELHEFFEPAGIELETSVYNQIYNLLFINRDSAEFDFLANYDIAIIGISDTRGSRFTDTPSNVNEIRRELYQLYDHASNLKIADYGNLISGSELSDTLFAVKVVTEQLVKNQIVPLFIGGGQHFTFPIYLGLAEADNLVNLLSIDATFDLGDESDTTLHSGNYLSKIITHHPSLLFNYTALAYQTYLVHPGEAELIDKLNFDRIRLGELTKDITEAEPYIRGAEIVSVDTLSVRHSDFASSCQSPHGLYGEELCQLLRYCGFSDNLKVLGIFETNTDIPGRVQARLVAQAIWHFFDGFKNKIKERPHNNRELFLKYVVNFDVAEIVFYKNKLTSKWWMEIPYPTADEIKEYKTLLIPCSENDYHKALVSELPDRWIKARNKLS